MNNDKDSIDADLELAKEVAQTFVPEIIRILITDGVIDTSRAEDKAYILKKIKDNSKDILKSVEISISYESEILSAIDSELNADRVEIGIILTGIYVEHVLNRFYAVLFERKGHTNSQIKYEVKHQNIPSKVSTYFKKITGETFNYELGKKILSLNCTRNNLVHYKAFSFLMDEDAEYETFRRNIKNTRRVIRTITENLEPYLQDIENNLFSNSREAKEIAKRLFKN